MFRVPRLPVLLFFNVELKSDFLQGKSTGKTRRIGELVGDVSRLDQIGNERLVTKRIGRSQQQVAILRVAVQRIDGLRDACSVRRYSVLV